MSATLDGELVFARMPDWLARADELASAGTLDLSRVARADSSGVAFLLELTRLARKLGRDLAFSNPGSALSSLLEFLQVEDVLTIRR